MDDSSRSFILIRTRRPAVATGVYAWRLLKCADGSLRVAGLDASKRNCRVSEPIERIDFGSRTITTSAEVITLLASKPDCGSEIIPKLVRELAASDSQCRCLAGSIKSYLDITDFVFDEVDGLSTRTQIETFLRTREFLETIVASEEPLLWDLVRTYSQLLLRRFPTVSECPLNFRKYAVRDVAAREPGA